ncbi:MAG: hypothetical protein AB1758_36220 [Candidatus Eremiobacterota bacterium]
MYKEAYLEKNFDDFNFFDPQCRDRRIREIHQRTKRCLSCPGLSTCSLHPEYWLQGQVDRAQVNEKLPADA